MAKDESFREFCMTQVQRLSVFREFGFIAGPAMKDYRDWLEKRCASKARVIAVMNTAVELEQMPTLADLNRIRESLFPPVAAPEKSAEERQATSRFLHEWYAQEEAEAEKRKAAFAEMARNRVSRPKVKLPWPLP